MILLLGAMSPILMEYAFEIGRELSCYKLMNYVIADHMLFRAIQENEIGRFIEELLKNIPRRLCMDKRKRLSLRNCIRMEQSYYNEQKMNELYLRVA